MQFSWQRLLPSFFKKENWCTEKLTNLSWVTGNENWDWIKICWTLMWMFFFFFFFIPGCSLWTLKLQEAAITTIPLCIFQGPLLTTTIFDRILLFLLETAHLVSLWSKLRGICREDMEGKLMGTTHKSSTSAHAIIYRSAYFRSAQFGFH